MAGKPAQDHRIEAPPTITLSPIAIARTPYRERYGVPNQAATLRGAKDGVPAIGRIELLPHVPDAALSDLWGFDYVWAIFLFHLNHSYRPKVRPPRAPHREVGVLASRAPHRPCPIGLSALRVTAVEPRAVVVQGIDLIDGTPVLDLKPYVPYADAFPDARAGWLDEVLPHGTAERDRAGDWTDDQGEPGDR